MIKLASVLLFLISVGCYSCSSHNNHSAQVSQEIARKMDSLKIMSVIEFFNKYQGYGEDNLRDTINLDEFKNKIDSLPSKNSDYYVYRAYYKYFMHNYEGARLDAEVAVAKNADNYPALCLRVFCYTIFFNRPLANELYADVIRRYPKEDLESFKKCFNTLKMLIDEPDMSKYP